MAISGVNGTSSARIRSKTISAQAAAVAIVELVTMVAVLWANLAYLLVNAGLLWRRRHSWPPAASPSGVFTLGAFGPWINAAAVLWSAFMIVNVGWPRTEVYGEDWFEQYAAVLFTGGLLVVGGGYYALVQRHKTGVLPEHRCDGETKPE